MDQWRQNKLLGNRNISLNSLNPAFPPFGDHTPGSLFHLIQCVSYLNVICARSKEHIEALGDLFSPKLSSVTALFLIHIEKNHPVVSSFTWVSPDHLNITWTWPVFDSHLCRTTLWECEYIGGYFRYKYVLTYVNFNFNNNR